MYGDVERMILLLCKLQFEAVVTVLTISVQKNYSTKIEKLKLCVLTLAFIFESTTLSAIAN